MLEATIKSERSGILCGVKISFDHLAFDIGTKSSKWFDAMLLPFTFAKSEPEKFAIGVSCLKKYNADFR